MRREHIEYRPNPIFGWIYVVNNAPTSDPKTPVIAYIKKTKVYMSSDPLCLSLYASTTIKESPRASLKEQATMKTIKKEVIEIRSLK